MKPTRKVSVGILAGAVSVIGIWALNKYGNAGLSATEGGAVQIILTFILQWIVPEKLQEVGDA